MDYKTIRETIRSYASNSNMSIQILQNIGIDISRNGFFKIRPEERTPSCKINKNGSFHDYGSGEHYSDIVSLLYDGYHAFDSLPATMQWLCGELGVEWEVNDE
jgi:hypothetical protein